MGIQTPFYNNHLQLGARIVDYAGFDMPIQYSGIVSEHKVVRSAAGLFDVSHMGEFRITGPSALPWLQRATINDVSKLVPGAAQYSALCYEDGGIVDDILVYMLAKERYMMVVNAANREKNWNWLNKHLMPDLALEDMSDRMALLALQGPASDKILGQITDMDPDAISYYHFHTGTVAGQPGIIVSATGYTGEKGYEIYIDTEQADAVTIWNALMEAGSKHGLEPVGLGARDTLRLEMGYPLYGNDISAETTPLEAGMGWITKFEKGDFIGREALLRQKESGLTKSLAGFVIDEERQIPRHGYAICNSDGRQIGTVTSGTQSVTLGKGIGMGYIPKENATAGGNILIGIRKKHIPATVTKPPFVKSGRR